MLVNFYAKFNQKSIHRHENIWSAHNIYKGALVASNDFVIKKKNEDVGKTIIFPYLLCGIMS